MYAPGMGRFMARDSWGGDDNQPMSYNAWLYGYANPVRNVDPSGYMSCDSFATFNNETETDQGGQTTVVKQWRDVEESLVCKHMNDIGQAYAKIMNLYRRSVEMETGHHYPSFSSSRAFAVVHGGAIEVRRMRKPVGDTDYGPGGQWIGGHIEIYDTAGLTGGSYFERHSRLIVHEMGHAFLGSITGVTATDLNFDSSKFLRPWDGSHYICHHDNDPTRKFCDCASTIAGEMPYFYGYSGVFEDWQFGNYVSLEGGRWREEIADMYLGWVYNSWGDNQLGRDRSSYMAVMMFGQIVKKMPEFRQ